MSVSSVLPYSKPMGGYTPINRSLPGRLVEFFGYVLFLALMFKLQAIGVVALLAICGLGYFLPLRLSHVFTLLGIFGILYVADATTTAFLVSKKEGLYRSVQFAVTVWAIITYSSFLTSIGKEARDTIIFRFSLLVVAVFCIMIVYHVLHGHLTTWKYLFDTKTTISLVVLLLFYYEDILTRNLSFIGFYLCLAGLTVLVMLSGERKAYVMLAVCFALCRQPFLYKAGLALIGTVTIGIYVMHADANNYIARQIDTFFEEKQEWSEAAIYETEGAIDQSDLIRNFVNRNARELFEEHPFLGLGATGYKNWAEHRFGGLVESNGLSMNVHGEGNRVPVEGGVVGILIAVVYMTLLWWTALELVHRRGGVFAPSKYRVPVYFCVFASAYLATEALDTFTLVALLLMALRFSATNLEQKRELRQPAGDIVLTNQFRRRAPIPRR